MPRGAVSGKTLHDEAFDIAKNKNYEGYECGLALMVFPGWSCCACTVRDKAAVKSEVMPNWQLAVK